MKKKFFYGTVAISLLGLSACSSDEPVLETFGPDSQVINIQVANTEDVLTSRAGRPLLGSEAKQAIDAVKVIITHEGTVVYVDSITNWNGQSTAYTENGHGRQYTLSLSDGDRLEPGLAYNIYAIGYNTQSKSDYDMTELNVTKGKPFGENAKITLKKGIGEEIFAGSKSHTVNTGEHAGFQISVVLNRQVAGAYGYFSAVPYMEGVAKLRLVANTDLNQDLILGGFRNTLLYQNGTNNLNTYVMNGANPKADTKVIYEINLADWYGNPNDGNKIKDAAGDGLIDTDTWHQAASFGATRIFKTGTCFGGNFVLPFAHSTTSSAATLELELTDADGKVLRAWPVQLGENDKLTQTHTLYSWNGSAFVTEANHSCGATTYNIVRNHLYGLGNRKWDTGVPPNTPDPDPDKTPDTDDDPQPLNKKEELTLRVNDNWEVLHNMGLGDPYVPGATE